MNIQETIDLGDGNLIDIGSATWDSAETSVRHRRATGNGDAGAHALREIPIGDIGPIVAAVAQRGLLDPLTTTRLIEVLAASLARQLTAQSPPSLRALLERVTDENLHAEVETGPAVGKEVW